MDGENAVPRWLTCPKSHSWKEGKLKDSPKFISSTSGLLPAVKKACERSLRQIWGPESHSVLSCPFFCTHLATDPAIQTWIRTRLLLSKARPVCRIGVRGKKSRQKWSGGGLEPSHLGTVGRSRQLWTEETHSRKCMQACSLPSSAASLIKVRLLGAAGNYTFSHMHTFFNYVKEQSVVWSRPFIWRNLWQNRPVSEKLIKWKNTPSTLEWLPVEEER